MRVTSEAAKWHHLVHEVPMTLAPEFVAADEEVVDELARSLQRLGCRFHSAAPKRVTPFAWA